ncbi:HPr family phosphocarrier protein [Hoyosella subflava]|uniref:Phosphocarrier protein HPr n=1 Tax=Hoyosella subflava (strain DSM 45089 / JCM 17490 / NBRC 109087 / DQS3-9A1) TaxID=443218 RepID=F6EQL6_HOYSD|nr:HPr family phosphocarrier protein [Hoyosella subflava]AEF41893.1 Phosphotransferase system, phosphocarrier protein HPr [Hoyosella subflava DQS3-9A1]
MITRTAVIGSSVGLHARPAAQFTRAAADTGRPVTIAVEGGEPVDATSLLAVMTLGAGHQQAVILSTDDCSGAAEALDSLAALLSTDFDS